MSFGAPSPPNALNTSTQQGAFNTQAAQQQQKMNFTNQQTPYGSLQYASDPNSPSGYSANVNLTPAEQNLLQTQQGTQQTLGNKAGQLAANLSPNGPDPTAVTNQLMGWNQQYMAPIYKQQQDALNSQLANQGQQSG